MFIEDIISRLDQEYSFSFTGDYERKFGRSIARRIRDGNALTSKQGYACLKMLRGIGELESYLSIPKTTLESLLASPQWKQPLVPSIELKPEVRYVGDNVLGFRATIGRTFETKASAMKAQFAHGMKLVPVTSPALLEKAIETIGEFGFDYDEATEKYLADALERRSFEPRISAVGDKMVFDIPDHQPLAQFIHHVLGADYL